MRCRRPASTGHQSPLILRMFSLGSGRSAPEDAMTEGTELCPLYRTQPVHSAQQSRLPRRPTATPTEAIVSTGSFSFLSLSPPPAPTETGISHYLDAHEAELQMSKAARTDEASRGAAWDATLLQVLKGTSLRHRLIQTTQSRTRTPSPHKRPAPVPSSASAYAPAPQAQASSLFCSDRSTRLRRQGVGARPRWTSCIISARQRVRGEGRGGLCAALKERDGV
ncbi:hypothetical protein BD779DRAFT_1720397 [Infundibulicybe gibba]|nr:hypothetical protein BD779DRAFT_1720397 [Infundibulicybe gibba]